MPEKPSAPLTLSLEAVAALQTEFSIDDSRLYITGLSMGGYGAWDAIQRHPDRFAAALPICGGGDTAQAKQLVGLPIWVFHAGADRVVQPRRPRSIRNRY